MRIEDQVCGLELARKLKELGVKQDGYFFWMKLNKPVIEWILAINNQHLDQDKGDVSAFTVAELGEMLPEYLSINGETFYYRAYKNQVTYHHPKMCEIVVGGDTEADARAKMLINLIERGIII